MMAQLDCEAPPPAREEVPACAYSCRWQAPSIPISGGLSGWGGSAYPGMRYDMRDASTGTLPLEDVMKIELFMLICNVRSDEMRTQIVCWFRTIYVDSRGCRKPELTIRFS